MVSKSLIFEVNRCSNETFEGNQTERCHSKEEINDFISNITIETWANYYKIDFLLHPERPAVRFEDWIRTDRLQPDQVITNNLQLVKNKVQTEDSWISLGQITWSFDFFQMHSSEGKSFFGF